MTYAPPAPAYIQAIAPYVAGKPIEELAREMGLAVNDIVKLASNENPLGIPASAKAAMRAAIDELGRYPDANGFELKQAISQKLGVPTEWLTLGNGSNDGLELAARAFLSPSVSAVYSQFAFIVYALATQASGAKAIVVPAKDLGHDLPAMLTAIQSDTQLVMVANPNNPTGTALNPSDLHDFIAKVPQRCVIVLDEAYNEYLSPEQRYDSTAWVKEFPNLIISRTFSKAFGLAGLRVGYCVAQTAVTDMLNRVRQPFNVNSLAMAAAVAALNDSAFLAESYAVNTAGKAQLCAAFDALKLSYVPSSGNFVLVKFASKEQANAVNNSLLKQGVIVRPVGGYGLGEYLRVSIGLASENEKFIAALTTALA